MATAPTVQSLDDVVASLNPLYQSSVNSINAQKALVPQKYDAQRSALDAQKVQGFNQINNQATGRGLSFSGIPLDEQAKYLSTTYLPGVQQANFQQNADVLALDQSLAQLDLQKGTQAFGYRQQQQSALDQYLQQQAQNEFTAQQNALDRALSASNSARSSSSRAAAASDDTTPEQFAAQFYAESYDPARNKTAKGAAESLIGQLVARGLSPEQASSTAYNIRKQLYKE